MRNPFARLAKPDTARPSLRECAASLKASASRVVRRSRWMPRRSRPMQRWLLTPSWPLSLRRGVFTWNAPAPSMWICPPGR